VPFFGDEDAPTTGPADGSDDIAIPAPAKRPSENLGTPLGLAARNAAQAHKPFEVDAYETVTTMECLTERIAQATAQGHVAVDVKINSIDPLQADIVGIALALEPCKALYIPLQHRGGSDLFGGGLVPGQLGTEEVLTALKPLFEDRSVLKIGHDIKTARLVLDRHRIALNAYDDVMLMSYVLDAGKGPHGKDELSRRHLAHAPITFEEVAGTGRAKIAFDHVEIARATAFSAEGADITLRLWRLLKPRLLAERRLTVYETLERPLIDVLARMENRGIGIDRQILSRLSGDFAQTWRGSRLRSTSLRANTFSIGSPKQIGDILFGRWVLPGPRRPSGQWATPATPQKENKKETRRKPATSFPKKILEWRQLSKLKSTYTDLCPPTSIPTRSGSTPPSPCARPRTGLSSSDPNLQNIPIRTEKAQDPHASWRSGATRSSRPTTARSSCGCSPTSPTSRSSSRRSRKASTFTPPPPRPCSACPSRISTRTCAARPRPSTSASSTASPPSARRAARHREQRSRHLHQAIF
jgi:DNA polymerase-1